MTAEGIGMKWMIGAAALALSAGAAAGEPAPLPPGWTSEHEDEGDEDYVRPPLVRGIYGHGFAGRVAPRGDERLCRGDAAAQAEFARRAGPHERELWFYSTGVQGALFTRRVLIDNARRCAEPLRYEHAMTRAFVADGLIHSVEVKGNGDLEDAESRAFTETAGGYSADFYPLHNLMSRPAIPRTGRFRIEDREVAGLPARCRMVGGLAWTTVCRSRARGRTQGMLLIAAAGDDEGVGFEMHLDEVRPDVELDGRLFELERDWDGPR